MKRDSLKKVSNVREGCFMLQRVFVKVEQKTVLSVRSLHNSREEKYILEYEYHVQRAYNQALWEK